MSDREDDPKKPVSLTHYPQRVQLQEGDAHGLVVLFSAGEDLDRAEHESYYMNRAAWLKLARAVIEHFEGVDLHKLAKPTRIN